MTQSEPSTPEDLAATAGGKSGIITSLCVIGVIVGGLGICSPVGLILTYNNSVATTQGVDPLRADRLIFQWQVAISIVNFLLSFLLIASAIGSLTFKPTARRGMVFWAAAALAVSIGWYFLSKNILEPRFDALMMSQPPDRRPPPSAKKIQNIKAALAIGYELLVLLVFTRSWVIESFEKPSDEPAV